MGRLWSYIASSLVGKRGGLFSCGTGTSRDGYFLCFFDQCELVLLAMPLARGLAIDSAGCWYLYRLFDLISLCVLVRGWSLGLGRLSSFFPTQPLPRPERTMNGALFYTAV